MQEVLLCMTLKTGEMQCCTLEAAAATVVCPKDAAKPASSIGSISFPLAAADTLLEKTLCPPVDTATAVEAIVNCLNGSEPRSSGLLRRSSGLLRRK